MNQKEEKIFYFAYGSNMFSERLRAKNRAPSAEYYCNAKLLKHKLAFHKISIDRSGKCDAYYTGCNDDFVMGVLYRINASEKTSLDIAEGHGSGYERTTVTVLTDRGEKPAMTYLAKATHIDANLKPYTWYKEHVLHGARENNFPSNYIKMIERIEAIIDPNKKREVEELSIYKK